MKLKREPRFIDSFWRMWCEAQERERRFTDSFWRM